MATLGDLHVSQLNVEMHAAPKWYPHAFRTVGELYGAMLRHALACGLLLHHKERNQWGCPAGECMEYAWVSLEHAKRVALHGIRY